MRFTWTAKSNDGCFTDSADRSWDTQSECYNAMLEAAMKKMKWNIEYCDVIADCEPYEEGGIVKTAGTIDGDRLENFAIGYRLDCHPHMIQHRSYSGTYTYTIKTVADNWPTWFLVVHDTGEDRRNSKRVEDAVYNGTLEEVQEKIGNELAHVSWYSDTAFSTEDGDHWYEIVRCDEEAE